MFELSAKPTCVHTGRMMLGFGVGFGLGFVVESAVEVRVGGKTVARVGFGSRLGSGSAFELAADLARIIHTRGRRAIEERRVLFTLVHPCPSICRVRHIHSLVPAHRPLLSLGC